MRYKFVILSLLLLLPISVCAVGRRVPKSSVAGNGKSANYFGLHNSKFDGIHHVLGVYVDGGYSTYLDKFPETTLSNRPGYSVGGGILYHYYTGKLMIQTGLGIRWQAVRDYVSLPPIEKVVPDTWGLTHRLYYTQTGRCDRMRNLNLEIPLMLGTYFGPGFYFLVGPKFLLHMAGNTQVNTIMTTTASYADHFIGWDVDLDGDGVPDNSILEQMDNHGLRDQVPLEVDRAKLKLIFDLAASLEFGYEFPLVPWRHGKPIYAMQAPDRRMRISAFADFGVLSFRGDSSAPNTYIPDATRYDFATFDFNHILLSGDNAFKTLHNMNVGLRVTCFFWGK